MNEKRGPVFWPWLLTFGICCTVVGYFLSQGDHVTAVALIVMFFSALIGYWLKASRLVSLSCGLVTAALLAPPLGRSCELTFADWFGMSGMTNHVLSLFVVGLWIMFGVAKFVHWLVMRRCLERPKMGTFNHLAGFGIGAGEGAILSLILVAGLLALEPIAENRLGVDAQESDNLVVREIAEQVVEYAEQTRESALGRLIVECSLFQHFSPLQKLREDLRGLSVTWTSQPSQSELAIDERRRAR